MIKSGLFSQVKDKICVTSQKQIPACLLPNDDNCYLPGGKKQTNKQKKYEAKRGATDILRLC